MLINETAAIVDFVMNNQVQILLSGLRAVNFGKCSRGGRRKAEGWRAEGERAGGGKREGGEPTFLELCDETSAYVNSFVSDIVGREDKERIRGGGRVGDGEKRIFCRLFLICQIWSIFFTSNCF